MFRSAAAVLTLTLAASCVASAEAPPIRLLDVEVDRHRTIAGIYDADQSQFEGVRRVFVAPEGKLFLTVRIAAAPATPESEGSLDRDDMTLTIGGEKMTLVGKLLRDGVAHTYGSAYVAFDGDATLIRANPTYLVPEDAKKGTLTIAGIEKELDLGVRVAQRLKASDAMKAIVQDVSILDQLPDDGRRQDGTVRRYAPPQGKLLIVAFAVQPLVDNTDEGLFRGHEEAFGLALPDGTYVSPVGSIRRGTFSGSPDSIYSKPDPAGKFSAQTVTSVFVVPDGTTSAAICYYADPIAAVKVPARSR
ncbi:MAG TPA: hypothetical protein VGN57_03130 [Pirellulaceae bacterium]|jgi:hypothetical protein|nr:hypothetical protein [Pirellulaceae bacterium]